MDAFIRESIICFKILQYVPPNWILVTTYDSVLESGARLLQVLHPLYFSFVIFCKSPWQQQMRLLRDMGQKCKSSIPTDWLINLIIPLFRKRWCICKTVTVQDKDGHKPMKHISINYQPSILCFPCCTGGAVSNKINKKHETGPEKLAPKPKMWNHVPLCFVREALITAGTQSIKGGKGLQEAQAEFSLSPSTVLKCHLLEFWFYLFFVL